MHPVHDTHHDNDFRSVSPLSSFSDHETKSAYVTLHAVDTSKEIIAQRPTSVRAVVNGWRWELFTWVLGTLGFVATLVLLLHFDGRPQSSWKSPIQITTMIAALAQLSQTALLVPISYGIGQLKWSWFRQERTAIDLDRFDLASRGPDGSLRLLWHLKFRPHLVSLGAVVTILLLGFQAFTQQAVQIERREVAHVSRDAQISRATNYSTTDEWNIDYTTTNERFIDLNFVDLNMMKAVTSGLINDVDFSGVAGSCPTSKCTFQPYPSIGICVTAEDLTSNYTKDQSSLIPPTIPEGLPDEGHHILGINATFQVSGMPIHRRLDEGPVTPNDTESNVPDLAQLYLSYVDPCLMGRGGFGAYRNRTMWKVHKAHFRLCIQTLSTQITTKTETALVGSFAHLNWTISEYEGGTNSLYCAHAEASADMLCIDHISMTRIGTQIFSSFNMTSMNTGLDTSTHDESVRTNKLLNQWTPILLEDVLGMKYTKCQNDSGLRFDGFTRRTQNVAASITNALRTSPYNSTNVYGTAWTSEPFVKVSFAWLAMPAALWLCITVFFFATIIKTSGATPLWKSSPIALLHSMNPYSDLDSKHQMEEAAKHTKLRLEYPSEMWRLVDSRSGGKI